MSEDVKMNWSIPMFENGELETFDNNIHSIVEEYSKMMFKEKDQILTQRIIMKQEQEIERLNNILNELEEETRCGYYEYSSSDGDYIEGYDDGASKTADFFNKMIKELRGDSK